MSEYILFKKLRNTYGRYPLVGGRATSDPSKLPFVLGSSSAARRTGLEIHGLMGNGGIGLDCGTEGTMCDIYFITHSHYDHIKEMASRILSQERKPTFYVPGGVVKTIRDLIHASFFASEGIDIARETSARVTQFRKKFDDKFTLIPVSVDSPPIPIKSGNTTYYITPFKLTHQGACTGYGISEERTKLDEKYIGLSQDEIEAIKHTGVNVQKTILIDHVAYLTDTDHRALYLDKECTIPNPRFESFKNIIIECTFLMDTAEEIRDAKKKKHVHWTNLKKYVRDHPRINFIAIHFSERYKCSDIIDFFNRVKTEGITNITPLVNDYEEMMMKYMVDRANSDAGFLSKMTKIAGNTFKFLSNIIGSAFLSPSLDDSEHDDHDSHCGCSHDSEDEDDSESS